MTELAKKIVSIDAWRDNHHINWVATEDLVGPLTAQSYRPEIIEAIHAVKRLDKSNKLSEICSSGISQGRSPKYSDNGMKCLKTQNVQSVLVDSETDSFVSFRYASNNKKLIISPETILMNRSGAGSIGRAGIYLRNERIFTNEHLVRFVVDPPNDGAYVATFLSTWWGERAIEQGISGSTGQLQLNQGPISNLLIPIPNENIQKAIGNKVRKAERLRELIRFGEEKFAIWLDLSAKKELLDPNSYKYLDHSPDNTRPDNSWINNFDPADRVDPWPYHTAPRTIRNHLKKISNVKTFGDLFIIDSSNRTRRLLNENNRRAFHISVLDIDSSGNIDWKNASDTRYEGSGIEVYANDILFSCLNPKDPRVCVIPNTHEVLTVASPEFAVLRLKTDAPDLPYLLAAILRSKWIRVQASFLTRSSSLSRRRLQEFDLHRLLIPWRSDEAKEMDELLKTCISNKNESEQLIIQAKSDIEALIDGTLDEDKLLAQGKEIDQWLKDNPSPYTEREN